VVDGRIIDLSYNAARILGFEELGLQTVRLDLYHPTNMALLQPVANLN
jgi:rare lipoprotein A (peptidoglycan hydrolase)